MTSSERPLEGMAVIDASVSAAIRELVQAADIFAFAAAFMGAMAESGEIDGLTDATPVFSLSAGGGSVRLDFGHFRRLANAVAVASAAADLAIEVNF